MKKILLALLLITTPAFAESKIEVRGSIITSDETVLNTGLITKYFASGARQQNTITLSANTNTSVTIPTGAKAVIFDLGSTHDLHLIGRAGDRGISIDSDCPLVMSISNDGNTTILISNDSTSQNIDAYWF